MQRQLIEASGHKQSIKQEFQSTGVIRTGERGFNETGMGNDQR